MKNQTLFIIFANIALSTLLTTSSFAYDKTPPFTFDKLQKFITIEKDGTKSVGYKPLNDYNVFVNYELGMHCVGFDMSYCCIIPPFNSIQAQAISTEKSNATPKLLLPKDDIKLYYYIKDNSYSEGNKMKYWSVPKDVDGDGHFDSPGDNAANYVWSHLYIYEDWEGTIPKNSTSKERLRIGREIPVKIDSGPSGQSISGGYLHYSGEDGSNVVMTDSLIPEVQDVKITLTTSEVWDALGLPLTAFNDSRRKGSLRSVTEADFQPFQYSTVEMHTKDGEPMKHSNGENISYFGTNPVDIPNCVYCHSRDGKGALKGRDSGLRNADKEYNYWKKYRDQSEYMARLAESSINILELHDAHHGTTFLKYYNDKASGNRLGATGIVNCTDCHGDNISGNVKEPRPTAAGYKTKKAKSLSEAIHAFHLFKNALPDAAGRAQACQACHPTHFQNPQMNEDSNPFRVTDTHGKGNFDKGDVRLSGSGCYVRRDAHSNPDAKPPFFLNEYGKWQYENVATKDEHGKAAAELRGLYCTNCHNKIAQGMQNYDEIKHDSTQEGKTLRNKTIREIIDNLAEGDDAWFSELADPKTTGEDEVYNFYAEHQSAVIAKNVGKDGNLDLRAWNHPSGEAVTYKQVSGGDDWWVSASEPHCADCHIAPFVESETGGKYFPIDLPNKYSLYRYSKAHGDIACQSCHESSHGLYSTRFEGNEKSVDTTTHEQALQYSPDGKYAGPVTCSACHSVNEKGVPLLLKGSDYENDYWASVTLAHFMREGDKGLLLKELLKKYPHKKSAEIVEKGWK